VKEDAMRETAVVSDRRTPTFEEFVAALWRSAWLLTGDSQKAEDLVQTTLVKCWPRWSRIADGGAVEAYVRRAMLTTYTDWWRRRWTGEVPTGTLPEAGSVGETSLSDDRRDLVRALATLPRGQRAVLVLRYFEDLTEAQTAEALGISVGTVKSQSARALATLRASHLLTEEDR
jgi:RNA polymerase sigma-70 factor (sigma-E family)